MYTQQLYNKGSEHGLPTSGELTQDVCFEALHNKWKNTLRDDRAAAGKTMKGERLKWECYLQTSAHCIMQPVCSPGLVCILCAGLTAGKVHTYTYIYVKKLSMYQRTWRCIQSVVGVNHMYPTLV